MAWWKKLLGLAEERGERVLVGRELAARISVTVNELGFTMQEREEDTPEERMMYTIHVFAKEQQVLLLRVDEWMSKVIIRTETGTDRMNLDMTKVVQAVKEKLHDAARKSALPKTARQSQAVSAKGGTNPKTGQKATQPYTRDTAAVLAARIVSLTADTRNALGFKVAAVKNYEANCVPRTIVLLVTRESKTTSVLHIDEPAYVVVEVSADKEYSVHVRTQRHERSESFADERKAVARIQEDLKIARADLDASK